MIYRKTTRLADLQPPVLALVLRLAAISRPAPLSYAQIAEEVLYATDGIWVPRLLIRRAVVRYAPDLLERRAVAREVVKPAPLRPDRRRAELPQRVRALILARARALVEAEDGSTLPAYSARELGEPFGLSRLQVRRLLLAEPGGAELLAARRPVKVRAL